MENKKKTRRIIMAALFAAIIAVCTRFTAFPIPGAIGYVHIGDAFIFLAAAFLPTPYAVVSAALGSALADFMYGAVIYVLPTAIIKALMVVCFLGKKREKKLLSASGIFRAVLASTVMCAGYYATEVIIYGSFASPLIGVLCNIIQGVFSTAAFAAVAAALDATSFSDRLKI